MSSQPNSANGSKQVAVLNSLSTHIVQGPRVAEQPASSSALTVSEKSRSTTLWHPLEPSESQRTVPTGGVGEGAQSFHCSEMFRVMQTEPDNAIAFHTLR